MFSLFRVDSVMIKNSILAAILTAKLGTDCGSCKLFRSTLETLFD